MSKITTDLSSIIWNKKNNFQKLLRLLLIIVTLINKYCNIHEGAELHQGERLDLSTLTSSKFNLITSIMSWFMYLVIIKNIAC